MFRRIRGGSNQEPKLLDRILGFPETREKEKVLSGEEREGRIQTCWEHVNIQLQYGQNTLSQYLQQYSDGMYYQGLVDALREIRTLDPSPATEQEIAAALIKGMGLEVHQLEMRAGSLAYSHGQPDSSQDIAHELGNQAKKLRQMTQELSGEYPPTPLGIRK